MINFKSLLIPLFLPFLFFLVLTVMAIRLGDKVKTLKENTNSLISKIENKETLIKLEVESKIPQSNIEEKSEEKNTKENKEIYGVVLEHAEVYANMSGRIKSTRRYFINYEKCKILKKIKDGEDSYFLVELLRVKEMWIIKEGAVVLLDE